MKKLAILLVFLLAACARAPVAPSEPEKEPEGFNHPMMKVMQPELGDYSKKLFKPTCERKADEPSDEVMARQLIGLGYYSTQPELYSYSYGQLTFLVLSEALEEERLVENAQYLMQKRFAETYLAKRQVMQMVEANNCFDADYSEILYDFGFLYGINFLEVDSFNKGFMDACHQVFGEEICSEQLANSGPYMTPKIAEEEGLSQFLPAKAKRKQLLEEPKTPRSAPQL